MASSAGTGQVALFLKIDGVKGGGSQKTNHKDEMELLSFTYGNTSPSGPQLNTGMAAGRVNALPIQVTMHLNGAAPALWQSVNQGSHYASATLVQEIQGGGSTTQAQHQLDLTTVFVTGFNFSGVSDGDTPIVTFELAYAKMQVTNFAQTSTGGQSDKVVNTFDYVKNEKT